MKLAHGEGAFLLGLSSSSADGADKFGGVIQPHAIAPRALEEHFDQSEVFVGGCGRELVAVGQKISFGEIGYRRIGARSKIVGELREAARILAVGAWADFRFLCG